MKRFLKRWAWVAVVGAAAYGCTEELASPANCPNLCPGGIPELFDTVITPIPEQDSSFIGYVAPGQGVSLLASNGLDLTEDRAVVRYGPRTDSVTIRDTTYAYAVDSIALTISLQVRDTAVKNLRLIYYRMPASVDSTLTWQQVEDSLTPENLIDSVLVPDSVSSGTIRMLVTGDALSRLEIPPADSGFIAVAITIGADAPTGVRLGSLASTSAIPEIYSYVTAIAADTVRRRLTLIDDAVFTSFVTKPGAPLPPGGLLVGRAPSSRTLLRFSLPPVLRDSAQFIRATLQLVPLRPMGGLPGDTASILVRGLLSDEGAKSPLNNLVTLSADIPPGSSDTVRIEALRLVSQWRSIISTTNPQALMLSLSPEASSFTSAIFGSTSNPNAVPSIRITYLLPFRFQNP